MAADVVAEESEDLQYIGDTDISFIPFENDDDLRRRLFDSLYWQLYVGDDLSTRKSTRAHAQRYWVTQQKFWLLYDGPALKIWDGYCCPETLISMFQRRRRLEKERRAFREYENSLKTPEQELIQELLLRIECNKQNAELDQESPKELQDAVAYDEEAGDLNDDEATRAFFSSTKYLQAAKAFYSGSKYTREAYYHGERLPYYGEEHEAIENEAGVGEQENENGHENGNEDVAVTEQNESGLPCSTQTIISRDQFPPTTMIITPRCRHALLCPLSHSRPFTDGVTNQSRPSHGKRNDLFAIEAESTTGILLARPDNNREVVVTIYGAPDNRWSAIMLLEQHVRDVERHEEEHSQDP